MAASPATARLFLVSGRPGVGKTTLIIRVFESLKLSNPNLKVQGFFTREIREGSGRVGFEVVTLDGRKAPLASSKPISHPESYRWPTVSKYKVDVRSFESLALPELQVRDDTGLFIIDEVGRMELFSKPFINAVQNVLESDVPVLATIPDQRHAGDVPIVARLRNHPEANLVYISPSSREAAKDEIYNKLVNALSKH
uniref:AAA+ ATPase domain-containing protein n=1 Tax=Rhizophora mucronata TaxID=61149 RepID=A0A2P2J6X7_RHIMU